MTRLSVPIVALAWLALAIGSGDSMAQWTIHVTPDAQGSAQSTVRTLAEARDLARASGKLAKEPITIRLSPAVHYLEAPLVLGPQDSGSATAPVRWVAEPGATVSGATIVSLAWQPWRDGIYTAQITPEQLASLGIEGTDQLLVNGKRQPMARFPNVVADKNVYDAWDLRHGGKPDPQTDALDPARIARWSNPTGAYVHAMHNALWGDMHYRVLGKKSDGTLDLEGGWQNNRPSRMHPVYRYVEHVMEELDAPGEWFFDRPTRTLYFMPPAGMDLATARVEFVRLRHLVEIRGSSADPVRHVRFEGVAFRHACRTFMDNREPLLRSDWTTYRGGAVLISGAEEIGFDRCTFEHLGGNAIFVSGYAKGVAIRGSLFREIGANGIAFVGSPDAVRSPLFNYDHSAKDFSQVDREPGPKSEDYPRDCVVEDCLITRTGRDEKQTAPVQISMAQGITVSHCSIYGVPRAGINISEGTWGGHVIEYCDIFDTVLETGDHGSFNSWGRDRFWAPQREVVDARVAKEPSLPFLDAMKPNILRYNRWRCDHGWDIDLDDGSTHYQIYGNLLLAGGLKLREGYNRVVENNVIVNNSLHPHVWYENSGDVFRFNIVMGEYRPAGGMPSSKWGKEVDRNYFIARDDERERFDVVGCDRNSMTGTPAAAKFKDAAAGDFRVAEDSAARSVGFVGWDFPPSEFGVRSAHLRAIARTPVIPGKVRDPSTEPAPKSRPLIYRWADCSVRDFVGEEFSAYGASRDAPGVLVVAIGRQQQLIQKDDAIVEVNGSPVASIAELLRILSAAPATPLKVVVLRDQKRVSFELPGTLALPRL